MPGIQLGTVSKFAAVIAVALGLGIMALGGVSIAMGLDAKGEVKDTLVKEQVVTSSDAPIAGVLAADAKTAKMPQDAIKSHTFGRWGLTHRWTRRAPGVIRT